MRICLFVCVVLACGTGAVCPQLFIHEEQPVGTSLGRVLAEGREFSFSSEQTQFQININTSEITSLVILDSDSVDQQNITLQIRWSLLTPDGAVAYATVLVLVLDINDNSPVFPSPGETALLSEQTPMGSLVELSGASDRDRGANGTVTYSLTTALNEEMQIIDIPFVLNVSMLPLVFLQVSAQLDYENKQTYQLLLVAKDGGSPPRHTEHSVIVQILDANDQIPTFLSSNYSYSIPEGSPFGSLLGRVQATDTDTGSGGIVLYSLVGDNIPFSVAMDGFMRVSGAVDYETNRRFLFQIRATNPIPLEGVTGDSYAVASVSVEVTDVNDNAPYILFREGQNRLRLGLQEELICPTADPLTCDFIGQLRGTQNQRCLIEVGIVEDIDPGVNGEVTGVSLGPLGQEYFTPILCNSQHLMTRTAVFLYNRAPIDRENQTQVPFPMRLLDGGSPSLHADWLLQVALSDVNDNRPHFSEQNYGISLAENVTQGTPILTVRATDSDFGANGTVRYSVSAFLPLAASAFLSLDAVTGEVISTGPLDRETLGAQVQLRLLARDTGAPALSGSSQLTITLTDVNDNPPVFRQPAYSVNVSEHLPAGSAVAQLTADDRDAGFAGEVRYTMDANSIARIDAHTGRVSLVQQLDYEGERSYQLFVTASDLAVPRLSSRVPLRVQVSDYNDNAPVFQRASLIGTVSEGAAVGSFVLQVSATDRDSGTNGDVWFQLLEPSVPFLLSESGVLSTKRQLDRETAAIYTLSVLARDRALTNQLSASATLSVTVSDVDDNPPAFQYTYVVTSFLANQTLPLLIGPSIVTDRDSFPIQCSIADQSNPFLVTSSDTSCHLYATAPITEDTFTFQLHSQDTVRSVQSAVRIQMSQLTSDTINSSLVIEVFDLEQDQFLGGLFDTFLSAVSSHLKLHIWSFIPSPADQSDLRVLLSARATEDGALLSADSLYIELNIPAGINVTRVSPCSRANPCVHGVCSDTINVQSDPSFVHNSSHLFNQLFFDISPVCSCREGYTGERCERRRNPCTDSAPCRNQGFCTFYPTRREYVCFCQKLFTGQNCETPLSACASSPCGNGTCMETGDTFRCLCPPGHTGQRCEVYLGFCPPSGASPCRNGGSCVDGETDFSCSCKEGFVGDTCETAALCFKDTSYIQFGTDTLSQLLSTPHRRADIEIAFQMRTAVSSGLLAYLQEGDTFVILELINSSLHFLARSPRSADYVEIYPTANVSDGKWHAVTLKTSIHAGFASLTVDDSTHSGAQTDSLDSLGLIRQASLATDIDLASVSVPLTIGGLSHYLTELSLYGNLNIELSGTNTYASFLSGNASLLDYTGALRNLSINGALVSLPHATSLRQVAAPVSGRGECERDSECGRPVPCTGRGVCLQLDTDHVCVCRRGHAGRDCQIDTVPVTLQGRGAISYQLSNYSLETHLRATADWLVINRTLHREEEMGLRERREGGEGEIQVQFYGRRLDPLRSLELMFITRGDGVILTTRDAHNYAILEVLNSKPRFRLGRHTSPRATYIDTTASVSVTNASQFRINITLEREGLSLFIETEAGNATHWEQLTNQIPWLVANAPVQLIIGGRGDKELELYTGSSQNFSGCLSGLRLAGRELPLHTPMRELGVTSQLMGEVQRGCDDFGSCGATSCPPGTTCVPVWTGIRCVCELGKQYDAGTERCVEIDECQQPSATCSHGGQCIDGRDAYSCACTLMYTGTNCDEINAISLMIVLVVIVLFVALMTLPVLLWLLFRFLGQRKDRQNFHTQKYTTNYSYPTGTNTFQPLKQLRDKTSQLMQGLESRLAPRSSPLPPPPQVLSPPLVNYPPTNQMLELHPRESPAYYPTKRMAHTFPSANIPIYHHSNTIPSRVSRPHSPIDPEETHSIPGKRLIRSFNIYDI